MQGKIAQYTLFQSMHVKILSYAFRFTAQSITNGIYGLMKMVGAIIRDQMEIALM
jgi:hypothetical protein